MSSSAHPDQVPSPCFYRSIDVFIIKLVEQPNDPQYFQADRSCERSLVKRGTEHCGGNFCLTRTPANIHSMSATSADPRVVWCHLWPVPLVLPNGGLAAATAALH
jgi:hypothetical protein